LCAYRTAQFTECCLDGLKLRLHARLVEFIEEGRADYSRRAQTIDLIVLVVGGTKGEADGLQSDVVDTPFAFAHHPCLMQDDTIFFLRRGDAGDEIGAIERCECEPKEAIFEDVRSAERVALAINAGVSLHTSRNAVVLRDPLERISVHDEVAGTRFDQSAAIAPVINAAQAALRLGSVPFGRNRFGDTIVDRVDHPADRL
jgi:hypothetical protein